MKTIEVVAGIIIRADSKVFIARRNADKFLGGKWEFPGGKIENKESHIEALSRELMEEFSIKVKVNQHLLSHSYSYHSFKINLHSYLIYEYSGDFNPKDHDKTAWEKINRLNEYNFAAADLPIVNYLKTSFSHTW